MLAEAYASGITTSLISFNHTSTPINFQWNLVNPEGVIHPIEGNDTQFKITKSGIYFVTWTINFIWQDPRVYTANIYLDLIKNSPISNVTTLTLTGGFNDIRAFLTGQTVVYLAADELVSLNIFNDTGDAMVVNTPSFFTIAQIAQ
jgi:hypothetical protein